MKWKFCLSMSTYRADVVESIWSVVADGRWHSRESIVEATQSRPTGRKEGVWQRIRSLLFESSNVDDTGAEVLAALDLLVRYGFAVSSVDGRIKMVTDGPSPMEALKLIQVLRGETDLQASRGRA